MPITSTSANPSGDVNIFNISDIIKAFFGKVDLIIDSGNLEESKGSTVIDLTLHPPLILREGDISRELLREFY
jgi:L-threonylcarbamoyladenylate synthase